VDAIRRIRGARDVVGDRDRNDAGVSAFFGRDLRFAKSRHVLGRDETHALDEQGHSLERADSLALCANCDTTAATIARDDKYGQRASLKRLTSLRRSAIR
jgi:hypothetical protein